MSENTITSTPIIANGGAKVNNIKLTNKVQHHNELIQSVSKLDRTPLKIFEIALSCIDVNNPPTDNTVYLDKQQLFHCFKAEDNKRYTRFKEHLMNLQKQMIEIQLENQRVGLINITSYSEWGTKKDDNLVKIEFNKKIMPYILETKKILLNIN